LANLNIDWASFLPKSVILLRDYNLRTFMRDLTAGVTVGLVALPLAMAFAIASGVSPQSGLYCAILAGFLISALGGSATQIGGPTGAFVVVVSGIVARFGVEGLYVCTLLAGIILILLGLTGMGTTIKFIPRPVVIGFTNGIAVLIASTQVKDFFGLQIDKVPGEFVERVEVLAAHWNTLSFQATLVAGCGLAVIVLFRMFQPKVPGTILALLGGTAICWTLNLPLDTIGSRFGGIPSGIPAFTIPKFNPHLVVSMLSPAITIAMLGAIESLLSAVVSDRMSGDRHNPNVELLAQGIANVISPLAGGLPATGAIARTATNIRSGAKTPVAGIIHALTLLAILMFASAPARHIPLCILAAILVTVAYNMGEWREIPDIWRLSWSDRAVWLVTFLLTVLADLTTAVEAGMILAALLYIRKVTLTTTITRITQQDILDGQKHSLQLHDIPEGVALFRIHGPFLFGSTEKLELIENQIDSLPPVVVLRLRNMTAIDATGLHALEDIADRLRRTGRSVILCGMRSQPAHLMSRSDFREHIGKENFCRNVRQAVARAQVLLAAHRPGGSVSGIPA
jgi:sulfate permease, SulP family